MSIKKISCYLNKRSSNIYRSK